MVQGAQVLLVGFPVAVVLVEHVGCACHFGEKAQALDRDPGAKPVQVVN